MENFYSEWKETILRFTFDYSSQYRIRLTEPFSHHYFKKNHVDSLSVIGLQASSRGIILTVVDCLIKTNISIKPTDWDKYWNSINFKPLSPLIIIFNDELNVQFDLVALNIIVKFKAWLTKIEQAKPIKKNNLENVAIAEPHLINGNVEFISRLSKTKGGKQVNYSYYQYQLYCWAKYYYSIDKISYSAACKKTIHLHSSEAARKNGTSEIESLRRDITEKYDKVIGFNQLNGCCIPPNEFF